MVVFIVHDKNSMFDHRHPGKSREPVSSPPHIKDAGPRLSQGRRHFCRVLWVVFLIGP